MRVNQAEVLAFLGAPSSHGGLEVRRFDTHASSVFLAGSRALKIKRAVRFPFLDYSTLAKRKSACLAELAVNRPFAPEIYRRVVPITRENGGLAIDGTGRAVEWAVEMCRFDETRTLDRLAESGAIDQALADTLGREIAEAHARAPVVDADPWIAALDCYLDQNEAEFREYAALFAAETVAALCRESRRRLARLRPLLRERGELGLIRRGHGDLHLGNIAMINGRPVLFDAIEFSETIASGDVLYDLAFLLMDLTERGLDQAANIVLNRYLVQTRRRSDLDALAALPLFMSIRAAIRAKVTAAQWAGDPASRQPKAREAQTYFRLACTLLEPVKPTLVAIGGLSGTGKSHLARELAPQLRPRPGAVVLRSDVERKALFGKAETERLGHNGYRPDVTRQIYTLLADEARRVTAAGFSAIVDAVFADPIERTAIRAVAEGGRATFRGMFLTADLETRLARIGRRARDASDADTALARLQETYALGRMDFLEIDASGTPEDTVDRARAALRQHAP